MASSSPPVRPVLYLSFFLAVLILMYLAVFFTGDKQAKPKLGIDLQGGTRVTLTARTPDGSAPTREALDMAQQIINERVNGLGVSGSEVLIDGDNLVITVPGSDGNEARSLGQTARLFIRPVAECVTIMGPGDPSCPAMGQPSPDLVPGIPGAIPGTPGLPPGTPGLPPGTPGLPPGTPGLPPGTPGLPADIPGMPADIPPGAVPTETPAQPPPPGQPAPQSRPYPQDPPSPTPPPSPATSAPSPASPTPAPPPGSPTPAPPPDPASPCAEPESVLCQKTIRQNPQFVQIGLSYLLGTKCEGSDPLAGNDDPNLPLVTCSQKTDEQGDDGPGRRIYRLEPSIISGDEIDSASSGFDQQTSQWLVFLNFKSGGADTWANFTANNVGTQTAFVLDSQVVSAPEIREAIAGGNTQVSGDFNATEAKELANVLKYGSLPLSFESSQAETVSATLGLYSLRAGMIAGAIGIVLVLLYSLVYYRALGLLTALSLVASGAMVYAILILLGRWIGYTLDLAGIAGLIIGIGTTADSFVVFFERIKDEMREGRSFRSAIPRGWVRARKTILSGGAVTGLAAAVLYFLAIGQVKGFAFTLGLTTILDVVVVFLVTWPLMYLASKSKLLAKPALNGLGAVQQIARERRAAAQATGQR